MTTQKRRWLSRLLPSIREKRKLPAYCYDFFAQDSRDGEIRGPFATPIEAGKSVRKWRKEIGGCNACCIFAGYRVSETKILKAIAVAERAEGGRPKEQG